MAEVVVSFYDALDGVTFYFIFMFLNENIQVFREQIILDGGKSATLER